MVIYNGTYCVYAHINKINGKIYIGQTIHGDNPNLRWRGDGKGYEQSPRFWNAIQKYGWDNFEHEIIANNLTSEEANSFEALLISKLNTTDDEYGYNIEYGGKNVGGLAESTRKKLSDGMKGRFIGEKNPNYGNHKLAGKNNPFYGKKHSPELIKHIKDVKTKAYVWCFELNELFYGAKDAQSKTGIDYADIQKACHGQVKSAGKHPTTGDDLHWCFVDKNALDDLYVAYEYIDHLMCEWERIVDTCILSNRNNAKGIWYDKRKQKWVASIAYKKQDYYLGCFDNERDAIQARLNAEKDLYSQLIKPKTKDDFINFLNKVSELKLKNGSTSKGG